MNTVKNTVKMSPNVGQPAIRRAGSCSTLLGSRSLFGMDFLLLFHCSPGSVPWVAVTTSLSSPRLQRHHQRALEMASKPKQLEEEDGPWWLFMNDLPSRCMDMSVVEDLFQQELIPFLLAAFWWNFLKLQPMPFFGIVRVIYPWKVLQALAASLVQKTSDIGAWGYPKSQRLSSTRQDAILEVKQVRKHTFPTTEMDPPKKQRLKKENHLPNLHLWFP